MEEHRRNDGDNQHEQPDTRERNPTEQRQQESKQNELIAKYPINNRWTRRFSRISVLSLVWN
jgi:hypothetical protein